MSLRFMFDTGLCLSLLSDRSPPLRARLNAEADGLALSTIAVMELLSAANDAPHPSEGRRAVEDFASRFEVLAFDRRAAQHAADLETEIGRAGGSLGYDLLVAAHARSQGLILVTDEPGRFEAVRGLAAEKWS